MLGMLMGWNTNKFFPILGSVAMSTVLISVIIIKGLGVETIAILLLFIAAMVCRIWRMFMSTPL